MSYLDSKKEKKIAAQLHRVLILENTPAPIRLLGDQIRAMGGQEVHSVVQQEGALEACAMINPQIVFTEYLGPRLDGLAFVRALRRSTMPCRTAPVILMTSEATAQTINAARDAGVHEFLRKPFTIGDLIKRLEAVTLWSRAWVEAMDYIGPDRRRFNSAEFGGVGKRRSDQQSNSHAGRTKQALQILGSAIKAIESDPAQSLRAMAAQVVELRAVAIETGNGPLRDIALQLDEVLKAAARDKRISRREIEAFGAALCDFMPSEKVEAVPATQRLRATSNA
jgi:CheY-like chemotaxis protein